MSSFPFPTLPLMLMGQSATSAGLADQEHLQPVAQSKGHWLQFMQMAYRQMRAHLEVRCRSCMIAGV